MYRDRGYIDVKITEIKALQHKPNAKLGTSGAAAHRPSAEGNGSPQNKYFQRNFAMVPPAPTF